MKHTPVQKTKRPKAIQRTKSAQRATADARKRRGKVPKKAK